MKNDRPPLKIDSLTLTYCQSHYANISPWFLFYKYAHAAVILSLLGLNMSHLRYASIDPLRWHLYISHWSTLICAVEAICGVFTVNYFFYHCRTKSQRDAMSLSDGMTRHLFCYVYLNATAHTFASAAAVLFWVFMNSAAVPEVKALELSILPAIMLVKLFSERIPYEIGHIFYPLAYLTLYFTDVIIMHFAFYDSLYSSHSSLLFRNFRKGGVSVLVWFFLKSSLILGATHVIMVLISNSKVFFLRFKCFRRQRPLGLTTSMTTFKSDSTCSTTLKDRLVQQQTVQLLKNALREHAIKSLIDLMIASETYCRQDFIHAEWSYSSSERPKIRYLVYRSLHLLLYVILALFSLSQTADMGTEKGASVKDVLMWIFYMANFFLCVSLLQAFLGTVVILKAFVTASGGLKYYEKSDYYITGFQKAYCAINSAATALALFTLFTSRWMVDDSGSNFGNLHITYDSSHLLNPLAMSLDFLLVAHPYKMVHVFLSVGILALNIIFNYWLYMSQITSRTGKKFIYQFLNWDNSAQSMMHTAFLVLVLVCIHFLLWCLFLLKRYFSVALHRRELVVLVRRMSTVNGGSLSFKVNSYPTTDLIALHCLGGSSSLKKFLIEAIMVKSVFYMDPGRKSSGHNPEDSAEPWSQAGRRDGEFGRQRRASTLETLMSHEISVDFGEHDESDSKEITRSP
ncbi:protein rolling stone-like [Nesidiocoris tenuis]|uniref:Protein rolling stone-like n=1 Tax=Nesidiocoris tenuis TaxID=355587 RepID=A0ABN7APA2_9HEMI|nr:protein rolling stone-like [Nesidiocoris tenuis]